MAIRDLHSTVPAAATGEILLDLIRVEDLEAQQRFWSRALGYIVREPASSDFVVLQPADGVGTNVSLDAVRSERVLPPRMHLDLYTDDQAGDVRRLTALSAHRVHWDRQPADADYIIMEDPEGNRFCVIDAPE